MVVDPPSAAVAASAGARSFKRVTRHFIFGYGSLICPRSRSITAPTLAGPGAPPAVPCVVHNLERGWNARIRVKGRLPRRRQLQRLKKDGGLEDDLRRLDGWTAVGVRVAPGGSCSGVLIEVDEEELARFDEREGGYDRLPVRLEHVERVPGHRSATEEKEGGEEKAGDEEEEHVVFRRGDFVRRMSSLESYEGANGDDHPMVDLDDAGEDLRIWVYVQHDYTPADRSYPIKQSYVDIILRGCLSISEAFARSFIETTVGWWHDGSGSAGEEKKAELVESADGAGVEDDHHTWIDDRHFPLYIRSDSEYSKEMGPVLDDLVKDHHPEALERRKRY